MQDQIMSSREFSISTIILIWFTTALITGCQSPWQHRYNHYMNVRDYEAAKNILQEEIQQSPYNPEFNLLLGKVHLQLREYPEARSAFDASRRTSSEYTGLIRSLMDKAFHREMRSGVYAMRNERFEESASCFLNAIEINPNMHEPYPALGFSYLKLGKYDQAYEYYRQAVNLDKADAESFHSLSLIALKLGNLNEAIEFARQATGIDDQFIPAYEILVYAGLNTGDYIMAEQAYQAIPEDDRSFSVSRDYAFKLYNTGKFKRALPILKKLNRHDPGNETVLQTLAETYFHLNQFGMMAETYETLWKYNSNDSNILVNIIAAYDLMGEQGRVEDFKARLLELEKENL